MSLRPFEEIVSEHGQVVYRVCRALVGPDDAQDAWSETFLAALRAYPDLAPESNVRGWLVTIAHRRTIDLLRAAQRRPRPAEHLDEHAGLAPRPDATLDEQLREAVEHLPPKQRGAVVLRYLGDLSYPQIAELLECSDAAARRSASDGIAALRRNIAEEIP